MSGRTERIALLAILALAVVLRFWGMPFGLPDLYHADEPIVLNHALAYGAGDFNPHFFKIPPLVSYLLFGVFGIYFVIGWITGFWTSVADFEFFFYTDPSSFYLIARLIFGAIAGSLTVFVFYRVIRRHFDSARALLGSFLFAVCFLHVTDSHYLYADIPLLLVFVSALGFFWTCGSQAGFKKAVIAGAWIGLATAVKYNGVFIGTIYAVMVLGRQGSSRSKISEGLFALASAAVVFFALNPFSVLDYTFFLSEIQAQSRSQGGVGWLHHGLYSLPGALGWPILIAAGGGFLTAVYGKQDQSWKLKKLGLLLFCVIYYGVLAHAGQPYSRYVLPLIPAILFFAADFLVGISAGASRRYFLVLGLILLSSFPLVKSVLWCRLMSEEDVRSKAKVWIENNLSRGASVAMDWEFYMPRLNFTPAQLKSKKDHLRQDAAFSQAKVKKLDALIRKSEKETNFELHFLVPKPEMQERFLMASPVLPYDFETLKTKGIQYVFVLPGVSQPKADHFYNQLKESGKLLYEFSPYHDGNVLPSDRVAMTGGPFTWSEVVRRHSNGHAIQVYELGTTSFENRG